MEETEMNACFPESLVKSLGEAKKLEYLGNYDAALCLLEKVERGASRTCPEYWLLKNNKICCNIKKSFIEENRLSVIESYKASLERLLTESQGVSITQIGCITEIFIICNILFLDLIKKINFNCQNREHLASESFDQINLTFCRVKSVLFNQPAESNDDSYSSWSSHEEITTQNLILLVKKLKIIPGDAHCLLIQEVVIVSLLFTLNGSLHKPDLHYTMLAALNYELARKLEVRMKAAEIMPNSSMFVLLKTERFDLFYQVSLVAALVQAANLEKENALNAINTMRIYDERHNLHLLLKACVFLQHKEYEACYRHSQNVYSQMKKDNDQQSRCQLNLIWNILGICFCHQGKPNLAVRAFERSAKANRRNKASLFNIVTTLKMLQLYDAEIECLQRFVLICEQDSKKDLGKNRGLTSFEDIFMRKLCQEHLSNFEDFNIASSKYSLRLYCEDMAPTWILSELAESLYQQQRYGEAADAYLDLLRHLREGRTAFPISAPTKNALYVLHRAAKALLKAGRIENALAVCNHILTLHVRIPVMILTQDGLNEATSSSNQMGLLDEDVPVMLCKCECLRQLGFLEETISTLKRVLSMLENEHLVKESQHKRQKRDVPSYSTWDGCEPWLLSDLQIQANNNLGVALIDAKNVRDACQAFRNASKCKPEDVDIDVRYNFCKLMTQTNLLATALWNWNMGHDTKETLESIETVLADNYRIILR